MSDFYIREKLISSILYRFSLSIFLGRDLSTRDISICSFEMLASLMKTNLSRKSSIRWYSSSGMFLMSLSSTIEGRRWKSEMISLSFLWKYSAFSDPSFFCLTPSISFCKKSLSYMSSMFFFYCLYFLPSSEFTGEFSALLGLYLLQASTISFFSIM